MLSKQFVGAAIKLFIYKKKDLPISGEVFVCLTHGHLLDGVAVEVSDVGETVVLVEASS
jgi:hypothetical protein